MKNFGHILITVFLLLFSFYYTKIVSTIFINNSVIMKRINLNREKYEYNPTPAIINDYYITPGISGRRVLKYASYKKMMRYGGYNEKLLVLKKVYAKITTHNYYSKYINKSRSGVALIYVVDKNINLDRILRVLDNNNVHVTFFIDRVFLNNYTNKVIDIINRRHQVEMIDFSNNKVYFKSSIRDLESIKNKKSLFCYSDYINKDLLDFCIENKMHTVIPTINIKNNLFVNIKKNLEDGVIIKMPNNTLELNSTILYIKQRGYVIDTLQNVLCE